MKEQPQENGLKRKLGLFPTTNIVIANMIGAGIFTTSGLLMMDLLNPILMIVLWIVGGIIALCGAMAYGELGAAIPQAGGEYTFLSRLYNPILGFLSGWVSFFVGLLNRIWGRISPDLIQIAIFRKIMAEFFHQQV